MTTLKKWFIAIGFLYAFTTMQAETIYLLAEDRCFDRYEYSLNGRTTQDPWVAYYFSINARERVGLEIEKETRKWTTQAPQNLLPCDAITFDKNLVAKINDGTIRLFLVRKTDSHYNLTDVKKALYYQKVGSTYEVVTEDAEFIFNTNNLVAGIDISLPGSELDVFIEGSLTQQCMKGYILKRTKTGEEDDYKEWTLIPEFGIIEKRAVSRGLGGTEKANVFKLDKINGMPFSEYLNDFCTQLQAGIVDNRTTAPASPLNETTFYSAELRDPRKNINTSPSRTNAPARTSDNLGPCGKPLKEGVHIVEKGQTLYSIARRYGVSVPQIKAWNGMKSNIISPCQELYVLPPSTVHTQTTETKPAEKTTTGPVFTPKTVPQPTNDYRNAEDFHRVKSGETLSAIARRYGYTEDRFRWMNGLSDDEEIYPGQILRTSDCVCPNASDLTEKRPQPYGETPTAFNDDTSRLRGGWQSGVSVPGNDLTPKGTRFYIVRPNDTLFSIAKAFNTTVERLRELNNLEKGEIILPAQKLIIQ